MTRFKVGLSFILAGLIIGYAYLSRADKVIGGGSSSGGSIVNPSGAASGDILYTDATLNWVRRPVGSNGQILGLSSGLPVWSSTLTITGIGTAQTAGLTLSNTTAASSGAGNQSYSPMLVLDGRGWTGAASTARSWAFQTRPITGGVTADLVIWYSNAGGAYSESFSFASGVFYVGTQSSGCKLNTNGIALSAGGAYLSLTTSLWQGGANGYINLDTSSTTTINNLNVTAQAYQNKIVHLNRGSGADSILKVQGVATTGGTASTELNSVYFDLAYDRSSATGAVSVDRAFLITPPTRSFTGASTISDAATVAITAAPIAGTNATITRSHALWVQSGTARFDGITQVNRIRATGGTNFVAENVALSGGWGSTASVGTVSGDDSRHTYTITTGGTGIGANPTATLTFEDGTWTTAPFAQCSLIASSDVLTVPITWTTTATTLVLTYNGTPVTAKTYTLTCIVLG